MRLPRLTAGFASLLLLHTPAVVAKVDVSGVRGALRDNVMAHLTLDDIPCDAPSWRVLRLVRKAEPQIREALEAYGYYEPRISIERSSTPECWLVRIVVEPGRQLRLREVDITITGPGADDPAFQRLVRSSRLRRGEPLNHEDYDKHKRAFSDLAQQRGYFAGRFDVSRLDVFPAEGAADVTLHYVSGPRYVFGPVTFHQDVVRDELVRRFVDFRPGDPYDGTRVTDFYNALLGTGYFASVELRTEPGKPPDIEVPVNVVLTAARRQVYTVGAGYSTDKKVQLRAGYTNRRVNSRGHQFDSSLNLSRVESVVGVSYRLPRADPRVEWLSFDAGYKYENTSSKRTDEYKLGVKEFHRRPAGWIETRLLDVGVERFDVAGDVTREFLVVPGLSWSHTRPESPTITRPDRGHRVTFKVDGTTHYIGSDSDFLQLDLSAKVILPLWMGARVLMRGEVGTTFQDKFSTLPASVRYFAGGDTSVRGYAYESLGPTDDAGNVIGGSDLLVGSVELDQRVWRNWSVAAFVDTGNAFDGFDTITYKTGVGAGIRWYSPLGPIRVDVAFPLASDAPDTWRLHVTLGPDL